MRVDLFLFCVFMTCCLSATDVLAELGTESAEKQDGQLAMTSRVTYSDGELQEYGFTQSELQSFKARLQSKAGRWWGHLSPMELMMYSAENQTERRRFARMYLESLHPKSLAERDAVVTLYEVARDLHQDQIGLVVPAKRTILRPILFVDLHCVECKQDVMELVGASDTVLDIYVAGLDPSLDHNAQLIHWARSMRLPPSRITLNADQGIYEQRYGRPLNRLHLVSQ